MSSGIVVDQCSNNVIGGTNLFARNLISANQNEGIQLAGIGSVGNVIIGNYLGTDVSGTNDLGNGRSGVEINGAPGNRVGGWSAGERNLISGNDFNGVLMVGAGSSSNVVVGNYLGTDVTGTGRLGNLRGVGMSRSLDYADTENVYYFVHSFLIGGLSAFAAGIVLFCAARMALPRRRINIQLFSSITVFRWGRLLVIPLLVWLHAYQAGIAGVTGDQGVMMVMTPFSVVAILTLLF